jgi:methionine aminopeptidase type I
MLQIKNSQQIIAMKDAGRITGEALLAARDALHAGMTTKQLDDIIRRYIEKSGAKPSFLGYGGFPGSACISINDEVIHGIPSHKTVIREGDIVKVDVGAFYKGFHGDAARTIAVGEVSDQAKKLIELRETASLQASRNFVRVIASAISVVQYRRLSKITDLVLFAAMSVTVSAMIFMNLPMFRISERRAEEFGSVPV